jgi:putative PIN family toxin of toxin-antitoxin system
VRKHTLPVRAAYDTDIIRAGIRSQKRPEHKCLQYIADGAVIPLCTPAIFLEYEDVLRRPETLKATGLADEDILEFLTGLAAVLEPVPIDFDWRPLLPDADDDRIANCAINGRAEVVVSNNVRHLRPIEARFGIPVLTARQFVDGIERELTD